MRNTKAKRKYLAGLTAVALIAVIAKLPSTFAANAIDTDRSCSLTVNVADSGSYADDLANAAIDVKLYKVADVAKTGAFTSTENFSSLKIEDVKAGEENWEQTAKDAVKIVDDKKITPDGELTVTGGTGTKDSLSCGLYLVEAEKADTDCYSYSFNPYIISLPDNLYYQSKDPEDDAWIYDVTSGLKPEQESRYGSLKIRKTLQDFNASLKEATFVFQIEGTDDEGNVVYSNVASTTFDAAGTKEAVLDKIPAGAHLTVTEVYSGASYKLTSSESQETTIVADQTMEVDFSNTYDDKIVPGYGVTNHFEYDENNGWKWSQLQDNTETQK